MLGAESGSNAFDFDGKLEEQIKAFTKANGRPPTYHEFKKFSTRSKRRSTSARFHRASLRAPPWERR